MRFDVLVNVVREGLIWWFREGDQVEDLAVWDMLFTTIEEESTGWLEAVRIAHASDG